ncbi:hypothetical protein TSAR_001696 [Trichomalopsis sarcophagae]|uniref:Uncharacterized protein n=1 Tax=Trichomalopsis sarcophagae TaxID=543379 RepID=A0A232EFK3_9HYME|nr:hypothetical protein TSAR_001696 [Trichomalopsis sarcophagae]
MSVDFIQMHGAMHLEFVKSKNNEAKNNSQDNYYVTCHARFILFIERHTNTISRISTAGRFATRMATFKPNSSDKSKTRLTKLIEFLESEVRGEFRISMAVQGFNLKEESKPGSVKKTKERAVGKEIRHLTQASQWRHVPGNRKPADLPTRGCTVNQLLSSRWWEGPDWLHKNIEYWPTVETNASVDEAEVNAELKKTSQLKNAALISIKTTVDKYHLFHKFSSYDKVIRVIGWINRFCFNCHIKIQLS